MLLSSIEENRASAIFERLMKLLNVKTVTVERTQELASVSHEELCQAIQYWVDQTKLVFGEVVWIQQNQGLSDDGVDVLIDFPKSKTRFGFQLKSYGDISSRDLAKNVHAQLSRSKKHNLYRIFVGFAGDMTDPTQNGRVSQLISELHETGDYPVVLSPERMVTIIDSFKTMEHPLKYVQRDFGDASLLLSGVAETLTDENVQASVTLNLTAKSSTTESEKSPYSLNLSLRTDANKPNLLDILKRAELTGERVKIKGEDIDQVQLFEKGQPVFVGRKIDEIGIETTKPQTPPLKLQSLSGSNILAELRNLILVRDKFVGSQAHLQLQDKNFPLRIELLMEAGKTAGSFDLSFDHSRGDASSVYKSALFTKSLKKATDIRFVSEDTMIILFGAKISNVNLPDIPEDLIKFFEAASKIQERTGQIVRIPSNYDEQYWKYVFLVAQSIELGTIPIEYFKTKIEIARTGALEMLDKFEQEGTIKGIVATRTAYALLGDQKISLGPNKLTSEKIRPIGDIAILRKTFNSTGPSVDLEIESFGEVQSSLEWFPAHQD
jgi:hypothetical protein